MTSALRGDVLAFPAPRGVKGREQKGRRYAVVVQSNEFRWLQTVVVAPTSTSAQPALFRPAVTIQGQRTFVLLDQLSTIDRDRIGANVGHLAPRELAELESFLRRFLGLF
jgi:mRNA interferase MazF